ncbi:MAG: acyl carrier protein [Clostridia bacterium]|nr:acyl carrier protein [Clostridia bacterium]
MDRVEIFEKLKDILRMMGNVDEALIERCGETSDLMTDLGLSSVGMLYIVIAIEEFFQVRFDDVNFGDFRTVGDVIDYIENEQ